MKKIILTLVTLFSLSLQAKDFDLLMQWEYGFGGDSIVSASKGNDMDTGDGISYDIGTIFKTLDDRDDLHTALTIGFRFDWRLVENEDSLTSILVPLTLSEYYTFNQWRLGAGLTYHLAHKLYGNDKIEDIDFDNALGGVFSIGYLVNPSTNLQIGLRSTIIDYEANGHTGSGNRIATFAQTSF